MPLHVQLKNHHFLTNVDSVVLFYNEQDSLSDQNAWDSATITIQNTVRTTSTDTRAQQYVSLSIRSYSLGATHCVAIYRLTTYNSTSEPMAVVNHKNLVGLMNIHDLDKSMHLGLTTLSRSKFTGGLQYRNVFICGTACTITSTCILLCWTKILGGLKPPQAPPLLRPWSHEI